MGDHQSVGNRSSTFAESRESSIPSNKDLNKSGTHDVVPHNHHLSRLIDKALDSHTNGAEETLKTKKLLTQTSSINYTEITAMFCDDHYDADEVSSISDPSLVTVDGYRVKEEVAPLLRTILSKYGDIAEGSSKFSIRTRSSLLELVCGIYRRLETMEQTNLTLAELRTMLVEVQYLEKGGLDVKWLHKHLEEIYEALHVSRVYKGLKEAHQMERDAYERKKLELERYAEAVERKKKELEELEKKICIGMAELSAMEVKCEESTKTFLDSRSKMKVLSQPSLVYGLLYLKPGVNLPLLWIAFIFAVAL